MGSLYISPLLPESRAFSPAYAFFYIFSCVALLSSEKLFAKRRVLKCAAMVLLLGFLILPVRQLGRLWDVHTWWQRTENILESARGSNRDIIIPYCPTRHEPPFLFAYSYLSDALERKTWRFSNIAKSYGLKSVKESMVRCRYESADGSIQADLVDVPDKNEMLLQVRSPHPDIVIFLPKKPHILQPMVAGYYGPNSSGKLVIDKDQLLDIGYYSPVLKPHQKRCHYMSEVRFPMKDSFRKPNCPRIYVMQHADDTACSLMIQHRYGE